MDNKNFDDKRRITKWFSQYHDAGDFLINNKKRIEKIEGYKCEIIEKTINRFVWKALFYTKDSKLPIGFLENKHE